MAKILINGDSWASGEWYDDLANKLYAISHPGLGLFLSDKHQITNISLGRSSNLEALERMKKINYLDFDFIFWFQTEPLRDSKKLFESYIKISFDDLLREQNNLIREFYSQANSLGTKIYFLGGAGKIDQTIIKDFNNLISVIPCITEFLFENYKQPIIWQNPFWQEKLWDKIDTTSLQKLVSIKKIQDQLLTNVEYAAYFQPDGRHPNRHGHRLIYEKIKKDFNL